MEHKIRHLEFIQAIITRMNHNSFLIKGWSVTLVSALYALAAKDANMSYVLVTYIAIPTFWLLDAFYLSIERQYVDMYKDVRLKEENQIDFDLDASEYNCGRATWFFTFFSKTIAPLYGLMLTIALIVMFLIPKLKG